MTNVANITTNNNLLYTNSIVAKKIRNFLGFYSIGVIIVYSDIIIMVIGLRCEHTHYISLTVLLIAI